jgi:hypothetical protein
LEKRRDQQRWYRSERRRADLPITPNPHTKLVLVENTAEEEGDTNSISPPKPQSELNRDGGATRHPFFFKGPMLDFAEIKKVKIAERYRGLESRSR